MLRSNVAVAVRHLRRRRGWRQTDLGARSGVSRETVSRLERGEVRGLTIASIGRILDALDASVDMTVRWRGEQLDRLVDAEHAKLQEVVAATLRSMGWLVEVEVSFNHFGGRGRVDVLAFQPGRRLVLIGEVKSAFGDLQDTLGRLDVKARLGPMIARDAGWGACDAVVRALFIGESRTARRIVARHELLFARYSLRGRSCVGWLRQPGAPVPTGLLWFVRVPDSRGSTVIRGQRVRT